MEEQKIINTITNIFNGCDRHDWQLVHNSFYYEVFLDYFSLNKKTGEKIKSDEIIERWKDFLPKFSFTHHVVTNFEINVTENDASAFCKVRQCTTCLNHKAETFGQLLERTILSCQKFLNNGK